MTRTQPAFLGAATAAILAALLVVVAGCGGGGGGADYQAGPLVVVHTTELPAGLTGSPFESLLQAEFPNPPGTFKVVGGALPPGLRLDEYTGVIAGVPTQVGTFAFRVSARDGIDKSLPDGRDVSFATTEVPFQLRVDRGPPRILDQALPPAQYRNSYAHQILAAGGTPPYTFVQTGGSLPAGLTVATNGLVGNFPTQAAVPQYSFEVRLTDATGLTDSKTLTIDIAILPLIIGTATVPGGALGFPYDTEFSLSSKGGGAPITWSQQMPPGPGETDLAAIGMEISADGHLRGRFPSPGPNSLGSFVFTARVTDEPGQVATRQYTLLVRPGPIITNINPRSTLVAGPYLVTGLNFQPGAQLVFKPGPSQSSMTPQWNSSTSLQFLNPPSPTGGGSVVVRVVNPDGGWFDFPNGFLFPITNLTFGSPGVIGSDLSTTGLDCADVTGDGLADVVHCGIAGYQPWPSSAYMSTTGGVRFHKNTGSLNFDSTSLSTSDFFDVKFADVNTDGKLDIVAMGRSSIYVWTNDGTGVFTGPITTSAPGGSRLYGEITVAQHTSDNIPDLTMTDQTYYGGLWYMMRGNGNGTFTYVTGYSGVVSGSYGVVTMTSPDVNNDGRADYVLGSAYRSSGAQGSYSTSQTSGAPTSWYYLQNFGPNGGAWWNCLGLAQGDWFGDGRPCVFMTNYEDVPDGNRTWVGLYHGTNLTARTQLPLPTMAPKCVAMADLDFDTKVDAVVSMNSGRAYSGGSPTTDGTVSVYRASTQATLPPLLLTDAPGVTGARAGRVATGDLDGDGRVDILVSTSYWAYDYQGGSSTTYKVNLAGDGAPRGLVFFLNTGT